MVVEVVVVVVVVETLICALHVPTILVVICPPPPLSLLTMTGQVSEAPCYDNLTALVLGMVVIVTLPPAPMAPTNAYLYLTGCG